MAKIRFAPFSVPRAAVSLRSAAASASSSALHREGALVDALVSLLWLGGLSLGMSAALPVGGLAFFLTAAAVAVALHLLSHIARRKAVARTAAVAIATVSLLAIALAGPLREVFMAVAGMLISRFDTLFQAYVPLPILGAGDISTVLTAPSHVMPFAVASGLLLGAVIWGVVEHRALAACVALDIVVLFVLLCLRTVASPLPVVMLLVSLLFLWTLTATHSLSRVATVVPAAASFFVIACVVWLLALLYVPQPGVDAVRVGTADAVDAVRYGADTLPEGRMADAAGMSQGFEERMVLTYAQAPTSDVYLRGFSGAAFAAGSWRPLYQDAYEGQWKGMFSWLDEQGFDPASQRARMDDALARSEGSPIAATELGIAAVGANTKYLYVPANLRSLQDAQPIPGRDGALLSSGFTGDSSYELLVDDVDPAAEVSAAPDDMNDVGYSQAESVYRSFVEDRYLDLSDDDRAVIERVVFDPETWSDGDAASLNSVISRVRVMLATYAAYQQTPVAYPGGAPFASWFLEGVHEGNSAYFSTVAVMAFRAQGYPARYAEGYLAPASRLAQAADEGSLSLTSEDSHAWVEVYVDGVGWCPVEVTPGFYQQRYSAQDVIEVDQQQAGSDSDENYDAGVLAGDVQNEELDRQREAEAIAVAGFVLALVAVALLIIGALVASFEVRRRIGIARCDERRFSDDQTVSVPAIYEHVMRYLRAAGAEVDPSRPLEGVLAVTEAFSGIDPEDYRRFIALTQRSIFGQRELRAHEMRVMHRFDERVTQALPPASDLKTRVVRRYRYWV